MSYMSSSQGQRIYILVWIMERIEVLYYWAPYCSLYRVLLQVRVLEEDTDCATSLHRSTVQYLYRYEYSTAWNYENVLCITLYVQQEREPLTTVVQYSTEQKFEF